jgi:hypothetical protein
LGCDLDVPNQFRRVASISIGGSLVLQLTLERWLDNLREESEPLLWGKLRRSYRRLEVLLRLLLDHWNPSAILPDGDGLNDDPPFTVARRGFDHPERKHDGRVDVP